MILRLCFLLSFAAALLSAHVGVNEVYLESLAGPYPLHVVIRPPSVIPGVAEIEVRGLAKDIQSIRLTPMTLTGAGAKYPPTPESAIRSQQDPQYWTGSVWIMAPGSWQIRFLVQGARGEAALSVPVLAASNKVARMDPPMAWILILLIALLVAGAVGIAGAAVAEARLAPGETSISPRKLFLTRALSLALAAGVLWLGWQWWESESQAYAATLYKPLAMDVNQDGAKLSVKLRHTGWFQSKSLKNLLEEHGHRMHLFLIREASPGALYHLHPVSQSQAAFEFALPALTSGAYRVFADIVHANGFAETITSRTQLNSVFPQVSSIPPDDAGLDFAKLAPSGRDYPLTNGWKVRFLPTNELALGRPIKLHFLVLDGEGNVVKNLRPYLGMQGHLIIFRKDYSVFAHLHPAGTPSMSALEIASRSLGLAPPADETFHSPNTSTEGDLSFPFGFTNPGQYHAVLQFRDSKQIYSAVFDFYIQ